MLLQCVQSDWRKELLAKVKGEEEAKQRLSVEGRFLITVSLGCVFRYIEKMWSLFQL